MNILVSNDDGVFAPGLSALVEAIRPLGHITVLAPEQNKSGASNSLTLDRPLSVKRAPNGFYFANGTPSDCVHLAVKGWLNARPDLIVSGINDGANMGDDTLYSGTVAAATEGFLLGIPSVAFSLAHKGLQHLDVAAQLAHDFLQKLIAAPLPQASLLSVNFPNLPRAAVKGFAATRLGRRHAAEPAVKASDPHGNPVYWVGAAGAAADDGPGTDFGAVADGYVSVTPLQIDLTHYAQLDYVGTWLAR
jgi:5'-nucleotidase